MLKLSKQRGFTIVELIVVIAIMAILLSITFMGFNHLNERTAISNDKALVNQINRVLASYEIYSYDEAKIAEALIEEFGKEIIVESYEFGYDIYYIEDVYEFELRLQAGNKNHKSLQYYLNCESNSTNDKGFSIDINYNKVNKDSTYSKINHIGNNESIEYELEIGIDIEFDENTTTFISKNHEVILNDIVVKTSNDIELEYSITRISEVIYENTNFSQPTINDGKITFYYPGNYAITITDGTTQKIIKVSVLNVCPLYSELSKLTSINKSLFKQPKLTNNDDGSYNFLLPVLSYIKIIDYRYDNDKITFEYSDVNTSIEDYYDESSQTKLINSNRLQIILNGELINLEYINNKWYAVIPNLTLNENTITLTYVYQGINGKWSEPITQILILNKNNQSVTLQE